MQDHVADAFTAKHLHKKSYASEAEREAGSNGRKKARLKQIKKCSPRRSQTAGLALH
jgi:hypothetical protein